MPGWTPDLVVDAPLARRLIGQFPELSAASLEPLSQGWDRSVWLVGGRWVFGLPRREVVVAGVEREIALLPRLARLLPLPIPCPVFIGQPTEDYPWPFFGSEFLPGRELCDAGLDEAGRRALVPGLAAFLQRLHSAEVAAAVARDDLPIDPNGRADMGRRVELARRYLADVERLRLWHPPRRVSRLLAEAERLPGLGEPTSIVHGDLHFRHLLVGDGHLSGVIDWVDLCRADPAVDLQLVWSILPPSSRAAFLQHYGPVTEDRLLRARVLAVSLCAALAHYGHEERMPSVEREAIAGLERAATD